MYKNLHAGKRNSYREIGEVFFWKAGINNRQHILKEDRFKEVMVQSLHTLSKKGLADIFAFMMPNHIRTIITEYIIILRQLFVAI
jgi:hypothetical protein